MRSMSEDEGLPEMIKGHEDQVGELVYDPDRGMGNL
jgi:hypothetical protein